MKQGVLLLASCIVVLCKGQCPVGWTQFQDDCFVFDKLKTNWENADNNCKAFGGHLAAIETAEKDSNILAYLSIKQYYDPVWTDGTDQLINGQWVWAAGGEPLSYTNWGEREPDYVDTQMCVAVVFNQEFHWRTRNCDQKYAFVCEMKAKYFLSTRNAISHNKDVMALCKFDADNRRTSVMKVYNLSPKHPTLQNHGRQVYTSTHFSRIGW